MKKLRWAVLIICIIFAGLIPWWKMSQWVEKRLESEVLSRLTHSLGRPVECNARASIRLSDAIRGKVSSITISANEVPTSKGIVLKNVSAILKGVHINPLKHRVDKVDKAEFTISIAEEQLNLFLKQRYPNIPHQLSMRDGYILLSATPIICGKRRYISAQVYPIIQDNSSISMQIRKLKYASADAPDTLRRYL
ncbi:MAG: LmeA family phospholipid-binding protein, partial [Armatimonadota bacterium]